jgi:hypothetical protein
MTAKEKAKELIENFELYSFDEGEGGLIYDSEDTKIFALTCVNEILQTNPTLQGDSDDLVTMIVQAKAYWQQVKEEIEKL